MVTAKVVTHYCTIEGVVDVVHRGGQRVHLRTSLTTLLELTL